MICIICDPYAEKPFPKILIDDGTGIKRPLTPNSSLARVENKPLQESLAPSGDWKGFFQTVDASFGISQLILEFIGSEEDFKLLKDAYTSFAAVNDNLTINFVIDLELAANISPTFRKNFLLDWLKDFEEFCFRLRGLEELYLKSDVLKKCIEVLIHVENSDAEKILECKNVLEGYFCEHFHSDKENIESYIENLNQIRSEEFENGHLIPLTDARQRCQSCDELRKYLSYSASKVAENLSELIKYTDWQEPDFTFAKTEIDGKIGYWLEETDASIQIEKFRSTVKKCYYNLIETCLSDWSNVIQNFGDRKSDAYLDRWAKRFEHCGVRKNFDSFNVEQTKCTVTDCVPAYFPGQTARQITRIYIEVVKYETDFLNAVRTKIFEQSESFVSNVNSVSDSWRFDLQNYMEIVWRLEETEELSRRLEKLCSITKRLTSIDCKLDEEKEYE